MNCEQNSIMAAGNLDLAREGIYYNVQTDKRLMDRIDFCDTASIPKKLDNYIKGFYKLPNIVTITVNIGEYTPFPDIILKPFPMVSKLIMDVMHLYRIYPYYRNVILSVRGSNEYKQYFLLYIDQKSVMLYNDFKIKMISEDKLQCVISLEFSESILRRNAMGIELKEVF